MEIFYGGMMIDIEELKKDITDNTFDIRTLVCVCKDDTSRFIAMQYYHHYARQNKLNVELLEEMPNSVGTPFGELDTLYVCEVGTLEEIPLVQNSANLWIICEKIKKGFTPENYIRFPKLEEWQIQDYIITQTNVTEEQADLLMKTYKDIRKLDIEMQKLVIFRQEMFDELEAQLIYTEDKPIYDLVNALVERNKAKLQELMEKKTEQDKEVIALKEKIKKSQEEIKQLRRENFEKTQEVFTPKQRQELEKIKQEHIKKMKKQQGQSFCPMAGPHPEGEFPPPKPPVEK